MLEEFALEELETRLEMHCWDCGDIYCWNGCCSKDWLGRCQGCWYKCGDVICCA